MENKKITIEDLARMVQKGFSNTDEKFQKMATKEGLSKLATQESLDKVCALAILNAEEIKELKKDVKDLKDSLLSLTLSIDKFVKTIDDLKIEYASIKNQLNRHEKWFNEFADKLGVKLEY